MSENYIDALFMQVYGVSRNAFYALGACCIVLALLHGWRYYKIRSWAHVTMLMGFILSSADAFLIAEVNGAAKYVGIYAYSVYYITLAVLIAQWATSMQREIGSNAKGARIVAYISIGLMALVLFGVNLGNTILLCLVAIWMLLVCPKGSKAADIDRKRWQIDMAVVVGVLFVCYLSLAPLSPKIVMFIFTILLGVLTLYPTHTLSGHAEPPASSRDPETLTEV
ncbi:hypothetical protein THASP1DRAFT_25532 [Thamnocephalis sphaerospora]|uniref:Uncharacterized protein n=1 Tax=Thamnocephalis sphaerospora TaxID=78915 RepID=A0A4P9XJX5_9FUNG|nr:hypothetical protein THASP1DRAFT_25532 [Thamnocephalis sphaerospora]|eukprot:RKP06084.1 hypothetical protein THASP1DRAFT_25532 [Thamnocephalis sphaerospora]